MARPDWHYLERHTLATLGILHPARFAHLLCTPVLPFNFFLPETQPSSQGLLFCFISLFLFSFFYFLVKMRSERNTKLVSKGKERIE